jgi:hypothetical protein
MWKYLERWGRSQGYYADRASLFQNTPKANHHKGSAPLTFFGLQRFGEADRRLIEGGVDALLV